MPLPAVDIDNSQNPNQPSQAETLEQGGLRLSTPKASVGRLWGEPQYKSDGSRDSELKNSALRSAWEGNEKISWLITRVIYQELDLTLGEYLKRTTVPRSPMLTVTSPIALRTARSGASDPVFSGIIRDWETLKLGASPELVRVLTEAQEKLVKYLTARETTPTLRLLRGWRLENAEKFDEKWGAEYKVFRKGHQRTALAMNVPELIAVAKQIGLVSEKLEAGALWRHPVVRDIRRCYQKEAESRGGSGASAELLSMLAFAGFRTSAEGLMRSQELKECGLTWDSARALCRFDRVPAEAVQPLIKLLVVKKICSRRNADSLAERFSEERHRDSSRVTFGSQVSALLNERNISYGDIARAMKLDEKSSIEGSTAALVRMTVEKGVHLRVCPPAAIALFAARSKEEFEELLALKRQEIAQFFGLQRSSREPHPLKVERCLWGIGAGQLHFPVELVQNTEWHKKTARLTTEQVETALATARKLGTRSACAAVNRLLGERQLSSVHETLERITARFGAPFVRNAAGISYDRNDRFSSRQEFPTLPHLRKILSAAHVGEFATIDRRWHFEFAESQRDVLRPLGRAINTQILSTATDPTNYVVSAGFSKSLASIFRRGISLGIAAPDTMAVVIEKMGLKSNSLRAHFIRALNEHQHFVGATIALLSEMKESQRKSFERKLIALDTLLSYDPSSEANLPAQRALPFARLFEALSTPEFSADHAIPQKFRAREARIGKVLPVIAGMTRMELKQVVRHIQGENVSTEISSATDGILFDRLEKNSLTSRVLAPLIVQAVPAGDRVGLISATQFALDKKLISPATPFGLLAVFAARDLRDLNDLLSKKRTEIAVGNPMASAAAIEESMWGFDFKLSRVRAAEAGGASGSSTVFVDSSYMGQLQEQALEMVTSALTLFLDRPAPITVTSIIQACLDRRNMNASDFSRVVAMKTSRIVSYSRGDDIPDLDSFRKILIAGGIPCTAAMEARWQVDYSRMKSQSGMYAENPLGVAMDTIIAREGKYILPVLRSRGIDPSIAKVIARLRHDDAHEGDLDEFCKAWKISDRSPTYHYLHLLAETRSIESAVDGLCSMIATSTGAHEARLNLIELRNFLLKDRELAASKVESDRDLEKLLQTAARQVDVLNGIEMDSINSERLSEGVFYFPGAGRTLIRRALTTNQHLVKELYASDPATRKQLIQDWRVQAGAPGEPYPKLLDELPVDTLSGVLHGTMAVAGTDAKIQIIELRGQLDLPLWHAADNTMVMPSGGSPASLAAFLAAQELPGEGVTNYPTEPEEDDFDE